MTGRVVQNTPEDEIMEDVVNAVKSAFKGRKFQRFIDAYQTEEAAKEAFGRLMNSKLELYIKDLVALRGNLP